LWTDFGSIGDGGARLSAMAVPAYWSTGRKLPLVIAVLFLVRHAVTAFTSSITRSSRLLPVFLLWVWAAYVEGVEVYTGCSGIVPGCNFTMDATSSSIGDSTAMINSDLAGSDRLTSTVHVRCTWTGKSTSREMHPRVANPVSLQERGGREDFIFQLGMLNFGEWSWSASCSSGLAWAAVFFNWNLFLVGLAWCLGKMRGRFCHEGLMFSGAACLVLIFRSFAVFVPQLA